MEHITPTGRPPQLWWNKTPSKGASLAKSGTQHHHKATSPTMVEQDTVKGQPLQPKVERIAITLQPPQLMWNKTPSKGSLPNQKWNTSSSQGNIPNCGGTNHKHTYTNNKHTLTFAKSIFLTHVYSCKFIKSHSFSFKQQIKNIHQTPKHYCA